jgi:hypothetical protein
MTGIIANTLNAYYFLCYSYNFRESKDEIILVGFSRGAFTVRCFALFITDIGLLRRKALPFLQTLFELWKEKDASIKEKITPFKEKDMLRDVSIKVCAEWTPSAPYGRKSSLLSKIRSPKKSTCFPRCCSTRGEERFSARTLEISSRFHECQAMLVRRISFRRRRWEC